MSLDLGYVPCIANHRHDISCLGHILHVSGLGLDDLFDGVSVFGSEALIAHDRHPVNGGELLRTQLVLEHRLSRFGQNPGLSEVSLVLC